MNEHELEYEKRYREAEDALRPKLTPEFLETLRQAIRVYGHSGDMIATVDFGRWCYDIAEAALPGIEHWGELPETDHPIY